MEATYFLRNVRLTPIFTSLQPWRLHDWFYHTAYNANSFIQLLHTLPCFTSLQLLMFHFYTTLIVKPCLNCQPATLYSILPADKLTKVSSLWKLFANVIQLSTNALLFRLSTRSVYMQHHFYVYSRI
jgi:hypothetical protein